jgi:hypothetical protein
MAPAVAPDQLKVRLVCFLRGQRYLERRYSCDLGELVVKHVQVEGG